MSQGKKTYWARVGADGETHFIRFLCNPASNTAVAQFCRAPVLKSLYARPIGSGRYRRLTRRSEHLSFEDPVTPLRRPFVFANVWKWSRRLKGADWAFLAEISLRTRQLRRILSESDLVVPRPYYRAWLSVLHHASPDGRHLICSITLQRQTGKDSSTVDYWLSDLDLTTKRFRRLDLLKGTFL
jgi:hypothetical protein